MQGMYVYDTVYFLAAAIDSMLDMGLDLRNGSSLLQALDSAHRRVPTALTSTLANVLQALKNTSIEGVSGRQWLDTQTGDRVWLFELNNIVCGDDESSENKRSKKAGHCETRTVMVQDETTGTFRSVAPVHWPVGFGNQLPDDGSRLEPSKCAVRLVNTHGIRSGHEFRVEIQIANNFGDAPIGTQRLVLVVASAVSGSVLSQEDIFVPPNETVAISRPAPSAVGEYNVSVRDAVSGEGLLGTPFLLVVEGVAPFACFVAEAFCC
jgi:hypothetical protein